MADLICFMSDCKYISKKTIQKICWIQMLKSLWLHFTIYKHYFDV